MRRFFPLRTPRTLVLDTNVVLDLIVFRNPAVQPLGRALDDGEAIAVTNHACLDELGRVLAYPQLKLDGQAQSYALEDFRRRSTILDLPPHGAAAELPICTDPDDQKFLELAWHGEAGFLVTRDKALLRLARAVARLGRFAVIMPGAFGAQFRVG